MEKIATEKTVPSNILLFLATIRIREIRDATVK